MALQETLSRLSAATRNALNDPRIMQLRLLDPSGRTTFTPPVWYILQTAPGYRVIAYENPLHMHVDVSLGRLAYVVEGGIVPCSCGACRFGAPLWQVQTEFGLTPFSLDDELAIAADRLEDIGGAPNIVTLWRRGDPFLITDLSADIRRFPSWNAFSS